MSTQNWGHLAQLDYSSVTRPSLPREGLACETSIAAKGEIATARLQSRAQYRIFLFRERSVIIVKHGNIMQPCVMRLGRAIGGITQGCIIFPCVTPLICPPKTGDIWHNSTIAVSPDPLFRVRVWLARLVLQRREKSRPPVFSLARSTVFSCLESAA